MGGTILLALFTLVLAMTTVCTIREARNARRQEIQRERKLRIFDSIVKWLTQIFETIHVEVDTSRAVPTEDEIYEEKGKLLKKMLLLSRLGNYYLLEGRQSFNKYEFEEMADKYIENFGKYTDKLHEAIEPKVKKSFLNEYAGCEIDFENATNDFFRYIIEIRQKENL